jgi:hypothetical protein
MPGSLTGRSTRGDDEDQAPVSQPSCATADDAPAASDRPVNTGNLRSLMDNLMRRLTRE